MGMGRVRVITNATTPAGAIGTKKVRSEAHGLTCFESNNTSSIAMQSRWWKTDEAGRKELAQN